MKRRFLCLFLSLLICAALLCSCVPRGYTMYENKDSEISIIYPSDWEKREYDGSIINFFTPPVDESDDFQENVSVVTIMLTNIDRNNNGIPDTITLDDYLEISKEEINTYISDYNEISIKDIKVGNLDAKRIVYTGSIVSESAETVSTGGTDGTGEASSEAGSSLETPYNNYKWIQVIVIHNRVAYLITYTALPDSNTGYEEQFDTMISNWRIR